MLRYVDIIDLKINDVNSLVRISLALGHSYLRSCKILLLTLLLQKSLQLGRQLYSVGSWAIKWWS
jgi:hypothetical protein